MKNLKIFLPYYDKPTLEWTCNLQKKYYFNQFIGAIILGSIAMYVSIMLLPHLIYFSLIGIILSGIVLILSPLSFNEYLYYKNFLKDRTK
jgi:hypothetical protein